MPAASRSLEPRRLASPALRTMMQRRLGELGGLALSLLGIALLIWGAKIMAG